MTTMRQASPSRPATLPAPQGRPVFSVKILLALVLTLTLFIGCAGHRTARMDEARAVRDLGEAYLMQGSYARALNEFLRAEQLNPKDPYLQNNLGLTYLAMEKPDLAVPHFRKAMQLRDDYGPAQNNLATAYIVMEDWNAAIGVLKPLSEDLLYATPHYAFSNLGWVYFNLKDYDAALRHYARALRHEPRHAPAIRGQAMTHMAMGNLPFALASVDRLLEAYPQDASAWILKGEILEKMDRRQEARQAYTQAQITGRDTDLEVEATQALQRLP
ncbi:tetratricopeptide repeat protein [Desulfobotulus sp.]|jgi:Tfp pilus assembly protein PilF|uniref:tetratricopeptide repeat protein n=1 Tax=Desulfobotulus sp. TaxID=1940337 RepID=UPI002A358E8C|nr:tetratricopeptide repeat protein [Desulfobotulus sp.]MDY0164656.1 tetratricopeptide repeat protein [Desulfobotulus sp.]